MRNNVSEERVISTNSLLFVTIELSRTDPPNQDLVTTTAFIDLVSRDLTTLLSVLDQSRISERLLERARGFLLTWNENEKVAFPNINTVEVIRNENICKKAIYNLQQRNVIDLESTDQQLDYILVNS